MKVTDKELMLLHYMNRAGPIFPLQGIQDRDYSFICMNLIRSVQKKGLIYEMQASFHLSDSGKKTIQEFPIEPYPPLQPHKLLHLLEDIKGKLQDEHLSARIDDLIRIHFNRKHKS